MFPSFPLSLSFISPFSGATHKTARHPDVLRTAPHSNFRRSVAERLYGLLERALRDQQKHGENQGWKYKKNVAKPGT